MERIRLALVDDHTLFRSGLRGLLSRHEGFEVVADMGSGEEFLAAMPTLAVDVVFMDISMPGIDGGETSRRALAMRPELRIITLSMYGDEQYYTRMMECGASGFLLKDSDIADVVAAVETVYAGGSYFSRTLLDSLAGRMHSVAVCEDEESLSTREIEILACVCQGLSNQQIADRLFISKRTVDKHRANILEKTGCRNTADLVVYAIKNRLVEI